MMIYKLNNKQLIGAFEFDGIKYPSNWLQLATPGEIQALGIVTEPAPAQLPESLVDTKARKVQEVNQARDFEESQGFTYLGKTLDSDQVSIIRIGIAAQAAAGKPDFVVNWTAKDNTILELNQSQMVAMPSALAVFSATLHYKARALKDAVAAATTTSEVAQINW